jgi:hypothetical protein
MGEDSVDEKLVVLLRPIESFLRVEVGVIEGVIFVADLRPGKGVSHELRVLSIVNLPAFHYLYNTIAPNLFTL